MFGVGSNKYNSLGLNGVGTLSETESSYEGQPIKQISIGKKHSLILDTKQGVYCSSTSADYIPLDDRDKYNQNSKCFIKLTMPPHLIVSFSFILSHFKIA